MKRLAVLCLCALCLVLTACEQGTPPTSSAPVDEQTAPVTEPARSQEPERVSLDIVTTAVFDPDTMIQRTTLDPQGLDLSVYFEIPVFQEPGEGRQKINRFFEDLRDEFFSPENEMLDLAWSSRNECLPMPCTFRYECSAVTITQTEELINVTLRLDWYMGGVYDTWSDSYTFDPRTGELLEMTDVLAGTENAS